MTEETAITPEILGVTPRYVLQHNAISRAIHSMSASAKKMTAMTMALLPPDLSSLSAAFSYNQFCKALGLEKGGDNYKYFLATVDECLKTIVHLETGEVVKGRKSWRKFHLFEVAEFNAETSLCNMRLSKDLADFLKELKWLYSKINLQDIGKLGSRYGVRIYEIAISYSSMQGQRGNREKCWFFEKSLEELKELFELAPDSYPKTSDFRKKVVERPVKEINEAGIGIEILAEPIKQGRNIIKFRYDCISVSRKTPKGRGRKKVPDEQRLKLPDPAQDSYTEKALEHLAEMHREEFARLYEAEMKRMKFISNDNIGKQYAAKNRALELLMEKYGLIK